MLVAAGCDGYLGVWDLRKKGLFGLSDNLEEEIHSISLQKMGKNFEINLVSALDKHFDKIS